MEPDAAVPERDTTPDKGARWEDFIDVFLSPAELFARRRDEGWVKPFLIFAGVSVLLYYVFLPLNGLLWEAAMLDNAAPNADPAQFQQGVTFMKYLGGIFVVFGYLVLIAATALCLKLVSAVLEPGATWRQAFVIATFALYVGLLQQILTNALVYFKSRSGTVTMSDASFGALRFVQDPDPVLKAVLSRLELFPIWSGVLCAIGLIVIVGMPRGKAFATAAITWIVIGLPTIIGALLQGERA